MRTHLPASSASMNPAFLLATLASLCFGLALNTGRMGLRHLAPRAGAVIGVPTSTLMFLLLAPFTIEPSAFDLAAFGVFALVGLFFPAGVTLVTYRSNEALGPTVTAALICSRGTFTTRASATICVPSVIKLPTTIASASSVCASFSSLAREGDWTGKR